MWLNIPLLVLVFAAVVGISYWLVLKHPDEKAPPTFEPSHGKETPAAPEPARGQAEVPAQGRREVRDEREGGQRFPVSTGRR
jgi:hypothetical protein